MPTALDANQIRCRTDLELFAKLKEDSLVTEVNERIAKQADQGPSGLRRRLLATSVYLSPRMAPAIHHLSTECSHKLGLDIPLEIYVYSSPSFNAACFKPEDGRLFIMFSSSLLESFQGSELAFVMGHELGHHLYSHHDIPIGYILKGKKRPPPGLALELFAWSRYAEISADRAGAHCAQDLEGVARSLFKLASGLTGAVIEFNLEDFLKQVDEMQLEDAEPGQSAPMEDWFSTHPFSPLRVKALKLFHGSVLAGGKRPVETLEADVQTLMSLMEPSYLESKTPVAELMRRLLFSGALVVAAADGEISAQEIEVFERFFGKDAFSKKLNLKRIQRGLDERISQTREQASHGQCLQVVRDLCLIARADNRVTPQERVVLIDIAGGLGVSKSFVEQTLESDSELD